MKSGHHKPNQQYLLRSIVSDLKNANSKMDLDEILVLLPDVIEELLPDIISKIKLSNRTFSPIEFRLRELRMKRKRGEIQEQFENLEDSDPELIISASKAALNEISDGSSIYHSALGINSNLVPFQYREKQLVPNVINTSSVGDEYYETRNRHGGSKEQGLFYEHEVTSLNMKQEMWKPLNTPLPRPSILQGPLQKAQTKTSLREFLTLDDILDVDHLIISRSLQPDEIDLAIRVLSDDIKRRNEKYDSDCIQELYRGNDMIPANHRLIKPSKGDKMGKIKEGMRAILLDEYVRLRKIINNEFLNAQISYEEYEKRIGHYVRQVSESWPK